jgi:hypothetical protein
MAMSKRIIMGLAGLALVGLSLSGCATRRPAAEIRVETVKVPVRAACPDQATYAALKATRPRPLAGTTMPETAEQRVARTTAQLGRFEAPGGWADRAEAALDRCQQE